jgi:hypothetical protein
MCNVCGNEIQNESEQCRFCAQEASTYRLTTAASKGRLVSHSSTAEAKRSRTRKANHAALREWSASDQPAWLTEKFYAEKIQPFLAPFVEPRDRGSTRGFARLCNRNSTWKSAASTALAGSGGSTGGVGVRAISPRRPKSGARSDGGWLVTFAVRVRFPSKSSTSLRASQTPRCGADLYDSIKGEGLDENSHCAGSAQDCRYSFQ